MVRALVSRHPCAQVEEVEGVGGVVGAVRVPQCFPRQRFVVELMDYLIVVPGKDSWELRRVTGFQTYQCQQLDYMTVPHVTQDSM